MQRTKLSDRVLPDYTRGEEIFNMVTHIVGGAIGVAAFLACIIAAALRQNIWGIASGAVYGLSVIVLFTMSSIYHGLPIGLPKKVFQVLDHCTIFILIAGTYTPVLLGKLRAAYPASAWANFGIIWGLAVLGIVLNSIDLKRFKHFSLACYIGMGWFVVFSLEKLLLVFNGTFFTLLLAGGVLYTLGAVLYVLGKRKRWRYVHSVFHIFVDLAALLHFLAILLFAL